MKIMYTRLPIRVVVVRINVTMNECSQVSKETAFSDRTLRPSATKQSQKWVLTLKREPSNPRGSEHSFPVKTEVNVSGKCFYVSIISFGYYLKNKLNVAFGYTEHAKERNSEP